MAEIAGGERRLRRFYSAVTVEKTGDNYVVLLDHRPAKTPGRAALALPNVALAEAVAEEWRSQESEIDLAAMSLTRIAGAAIDRAASDREQWTDELLNYLETDLLCYRAKAPAALVERQAAAWDPVLDWVEEEFGARPAVTTGIRAIAQPPVLGDRVKRRIEALDNWTLAGLVSAVPVSGSAYIGLALAARRFPAAALFKASRVDEHFQAERWGFDAEAAARERRLEAAFLAADRWLALL